MAVRWTTETEYERSGARVGIVTRSSRKHDGTQEGGLTGISAFSLLVYEVLRVSRVGVLEQAVGWCECLDGR